MLHGKTLYVDAWDVKPPNVFYTYALFEWIFGQNEFAVRLSDYVFAIMACAAIYLGVKRRTQSIPNHFQSNPGSMAAILLALTLLSLGLADTAQTESYSLFFIIVAALLSFERRIIMSFLAGAAIGVAAFYKTTNVVFLLPIAIELALLQKRRAPRTIAIVVGGFFGWCALQLGVLAIQGSLTEYFRIAANVLQHHSGEVSQFRPVDLIRTIWIYADLWVLFTLVAIVCATLGRDWRLFRALRLPLLFLSAGLIAVVMQNKGWGYQYVVIIPGLIACCAIGVSYSAERLHATRNHWALLLLLVICGVSSRVLEKSIYRTIHEAKNGFVSITNHPRYLASLGQPHSLYYPPATEALAIYIKSHTASSDRVFIFGEEPGAYWRSGRLPATRFVYSLLFTSGVIPPEDIRAMTDSIVHIRPRLCIVERFDTLTFRARPETSQSLLETDTLFHPLHELIRTSYTVTDTVCDNFIIYRLKD